MTTRPLDDTLVDIIGTEPSSSIVSCVHSLLFWSKSLRLRPNPAQAGSATGSNLKVSACPQLSRGKVRLLLLTNGALSTEYLERLSLGNNRHYTERL